MALENFHLSDEELQLAADGELSERRFEKIQSHLAACWSCRARLRTIEQTIAEFVQASQQAVDSRLPPAAGPRALFQAQMAAIAATQANRSPQWTHWTPWIFAGACLAIVFSLTVTPIFREGRSRRNKVVDVPRSSLTPGAVREINKEQVCTGEPVNNRPVPVSTRRRVFEAYGIAEADPRSYEVDYLITPALGGSDDIHNLWPQVFAATVWNAQVKDALEDRLRDLVCEGQLDLATAQREIAANWIEAYKKYFHTDRPLTGFR